MAIDTTSRRTRRAILLGALGGAVAAAAATVGRGDPVTAADGDFVHVGGTYEATNVTEIYTNTDGESAFRGHSASGYGLNGASRSSWGVRGQSDTGDRVSGDSVGGYGVQGSTRRRHPRREQGLRRLRREQATAGIFGKSTGLGSGVHGTSTTAEGVYGISDSGQGVHGGSKSGIGVFGGTTSSRLPAVQGWARAGNTGVQGFSGRASHRPALHAPGLRRGRRNRRRDRRTGQQHLRYRRAGTEQRRQRRTGSSTSGRGGVFSSPVAQLPA